MSSRVAGAPPKPVGRNGRVEPNGAPSVSGGDGREPELNAQRDAPLGGQAVLEGVMMRGVSNWAVAVRKPAVEQDQGERPAAQASLGEIEVSAFPLSSALKRHRVLRLPIIRGVVALGGSLMIISLTRSYKLDMPLKHDWLP